MSSSSNSMCCCCCGIRCGTLAIGIFLLILHGLQALGSVISVIIYENQPAYRRDPNVESANYTSLGISLIWLLLNILLVRGISAWKPALVVAWLCWAIPVTFLSTIASGFFVYVGIIWIDDSVVWVILASILLFNYLVLCYWCVVVLMYQRKMRVTMRQRRVAPAPIMAFGPTPGAVYQQSASPMGQQQTAYAMHYQQPAYRTPYQQARPQMEYQQSRPQMEYQQSRSRMEYEQPRSRMEYEQPTSRMEYPKRGQSPSRRY